MRSYLPKKEALEALLLDNNTEVAIFNESWLNENTQCNEILRDLGSFTIYRRDRVERRGGGILVLVKSHLHSYKVDINSSYEMLCVNLPVASGNHILVTCYRPLDCDYAFINDLHLVLADLNSRFPRAKFFLGGDFNLPDIDWTNLTAPSRLSNDFIQLSLLFNLAQIINTPTRGDNILDLVFASHPDLIHSLTCIEGLSDHRTISFNLSIPVPRQNPRKKLIRDYNKANVHAIITELESFYSFSHTAVSRSVEQNWLLYKQKVLTPIEEYVPLVSVRCDDDNPWYTTSVKKLSQKKERLFRDAKRSISPSKWDKYFACLREYTSALKKSYKEVLS